MKKLQNNFTTPEQSKRLLELGVPMDSADCYYTNDDTPIIHPCGNLKNRYYIDEQYRKTYIPCWSVGRLIEIYKIVALRKEIDTLFEEIAYSSKDLIQIIIYMIEENLLVIDFSRLEE